MATMDVVADAGESLRLAHRAQSVPAPVIAWYAERECRVDHALALPGVATGGWQGRLRVHCRSLAESGAGNPGTAGHPKKKVTLNRAQNSSECVLDGCLNPLVDAPFGLIPPTGRRPLSQGGQAQRTHRDASQTTGCVQ